MTAITSFVQLFMQEKPDIPFSVQDLLYISDMVGRPPTRPAPPFGERLAALRKERGWTQPQLAERLGVTTKTVTYYERMAQNPTTKTVGRIAEVFGVSCADLIGENTAQGQAHKPGPPSKLQQLTEEVSELPRSKQKFVVEMLEGYLQKAGNGQKQAA